MNLTQLLLVLKARRRIILMTLFFTVLTTTVISLIIPKTYVATASVMVNGNYTDPVTGQQMQSMLLPSYLSTQTEIISSHNTALRVVKQLKLTDDPLEIEDFKKATHGQGNINDWLADQLSKGLKVVPSGESNLIDISFPAPDPQLAATITNAFVDAYIQTNVDLKTQPAKQTADWYNSRLQELHANLEKAQARLTDYQNTHGVVVGAQVDTEAARLEAISTQLVAAQAQSFGATSKSRNSGKSLADVMNDPTVLGVNTDLIQSEAKLRQLAATEGQNNPEYQAARAEVDSLRQKLANQIQLARQSVSTSAGIAQQSVNELRAAQVAEQQRVLALKTQQDEGALLLSEVADAQHLYDGAMQSYGQNELQSKTNQTDISVLNPAAIPNKPASPKILLNIILATFLGGLLGLGFGLAMERMERKVRSERDLQTELGIPVLGVVISNNMLDNPRYSFKRLPS